MSATSRQSTAEAVQALRGLAGQADLAQVGDELFAVADLLGANPPLRRALSDPSRPGEQRAGLAAALLTGRISQPTIDLVGVLARSRWASPMELLDAVEALAVHATVAAADLAGRLDAVEDELFRFRRIVAAQPVLRAALSDSSVAPERKDALLRDLLAGRTAAETQRLLRQAFLFPRGRGYDRVLDEYARIAAERRHRVRALAKVAVPLTAQQRERLTAALRRTYGTDIHLDVEVDPSALGGVSVRVGDEVIDGTIASRLELAGRRLAG